MTKELTTKGFPVHTKETAPQDAKPLLEASERDFGMVPNLHAILAESPAALAGYRKLFELLDGSSLSPAEREVVYLTANFENECRYCMAGHSMLGAKAGLTPDQIDALRGGTALADDRLEALHRFASRVVTQRGWVHEDEVGTFLKAGFTRANVLDVVLAVSAKVISNYTNHLVDTPLDGFMKDTVWTPPQEEAA